MLDGRLYVPVLGVGLGQLLVRLPLLVLIVILLTHLQELLQLHNRPVQVPQLLVNKTDAQVAVCLFFAVVGTLGDIQTLLKELQGFAELFPILELDGYVLVDTDQLLAYYSLQLGNAAVYCLLESSFQIIHGFEDIEDFLLADTQSLVGIGLPLNMLVVYGHVQTPLVEIGGCLIVTQLLKLLRHTHILVETFWDAAVLEVVLSIDQVVAKSEQGLLRLRVVLLDALVESVLLLEFLAWLDLAGSGLSRYVEEVNK